MASSCPDYVASRADQGYHCQFGVVGFVIIVDASPMENQAKNYLSHKFYVGIILAYHNEKCQSVSLLEGGVRPM